MKKGGNGEERAGERTTQPSQEGTRGGRGRVRHGVVRGGKRGTPDPLSLKVCAVNEYAADG